MSNSDETPNDPQIAIFDYYKEILQLVLHLWGLPSILVDLNNVLASGFIIKLPSISLQKVFRSDECFQD